MADVANASRFGPCDWPVGPCPDNYGFTGEDAQDQAAEAEAEAVFILWSFTGQRYGLCEVEVTPPPVCACRWSCACRGCDLRLPGPVHDVLEVTVDGEVSTDWVIRGDVLVSPRPWPRDVTVTYQRGIPPPAGAARIVSELARQVAYATCNPSKCVLPPNLVSRTRQGDTQRFDTRKKGTTGITLVDMWIEAANGAQIPGKVWSPDLDPEAWIVDRVGS